MSKNIRGIGNNSSEALWSKLEVAKELILKSINKVDEIRTSTKFNSRDDLIYTEESGDRTEEAADLGIDAINKIDEALSEVKSEK